MNPAYLLVPLDSALADSALIASAYFFPAEANFIQRLASIAVDIGDDRVAVRRLIESTIWAGTVATTFLPCIIFSSTFGPAPSHFTV